MHEFQRRAAFANEIAARAQRIAARVLLGQRDEPERGEQRASRRIAPAAAEAEPPQAGETEDRGVLRMIAGDAERLHGRRDIAVIDLGRADLLGALARTLLDHV